MEQIRTANQYYWMPVTLNFVMAALFVGLLNLGINGALLSVLFSTALIFGISIRKLSQQFSIRLKYHPVILKSLAGKGVLYALAFVMLQLNYKVDILLLQKMAAPDQVGFYSLGVSVTEQLWLLSYAMGVVLMSRTANADDKRQMAATTALLLRTAVPAALLGALVLVFAVPFLLPVIFGKEYIPSIQVVQTIVPGIVIFMIYRITESYFAGLGKPLISVIMLIPALVLNVVLNLWWIPLYGITGAAWATNVSYTLATLLLVIFFHRYSGLGPLAIFIPRASDINRIRNIRRRRKADSIPDFPEPR